MTMIKGSHLYFGEEGLDSISERSIEKAFFYSNFVKEILSKTDVIVLPEVLEELQQKLRILNGQTDYIRRREVEKLDEEGISKLELICQYTDEVHQIIKKCSRHEGKYSFSEKEQYNKFLKAARRHSEDFDRESMARKENYKNPINIGLTKETDKKILAAAYTIADDFPVYIFTRDHGITQLIKRIRKSELNNPDSGLKRPKNKIGIVYYSLYKKNWQKEDVYIPRTEAKTPIIIYS